jgi:surfeit locus 1 family protein
VIRPLLAPRLLGLHVLAVLATTAAVLLGLWQYGAWHAHRDDKAASLIRTSPRPLSSVIGGDDAFPAAAVGQPVRFSGRWLPRATVYVPDRSLHGRRGVWAVTPVAVCQPARDQAGCRTASAMLVVRGWAPTVRAMPAPPSGAVRVTGWLQPGEDSGLTDADPGDDVIPEMRIADAIQHVDQDLYGAYVIAHDVSTVPENGLAAVTPASLPKPDVFTGLRNLLYALEWWVFGGFAVFLWWRWCRDELERHRAAAAGEGRGDGPGDGPDDGGSAPGSDGSEEQRVNEVTGVPSGP